MAQFAPPSSEERDLYYFGLRNIPKLVARSSTFVWKNPQRPGFSTFTGTLNQYPKSFRPARRDVSLHQQWNNAASSLRMKILQAASVADWAAIDILSVGLNEELNNTLLIAVAPGSMSWHQGHVLALECKSILEEHGIMDVHCEIRESTITFDVDTPVDAPLVDAIPVDASIDDFSGTPGCVPSDFQLSSSPITGIYGQYHVEVSDYLGTKISMKDSASTVGTKGLYLALSPSSGGEPRVVALTCRHITLNPGTEGLQEYRHQQSQPFKEVIQVPQPEYEEILENLPDGIETYRYWATDASNAKRHEDELRYKEIADKLESLGQFMVRYKTPSSRVFGHLLYSPELGNASDSVNVAEWLRDWALIELLPSRHQAQLSELKNKVFVESIYSLIHISNRAKMRSGAMLLVDHDGVLLEKTVVPMEKLFTPPDDADDPDKKALIVMKYDATEGLTFGLSNTLKSIIRHTGIGGREFISEEWCITSATPANERQIAFSLKGDSGSCIWDKQHRVAGIMTAGCGMNGINDVTYAQPIERLLADIRAHGFDVSLVGKRLLMQGH
jgi:hypothetical protein